MLEQGIPFEEINVRPSQDQDYLSKSPMGKVPCMETDEGFLTETSVMLEFIEDIGSSNPDNSLYPISAFQRAKCRELMRYLELYVELPARRLYGDVFFDRPASDEEKADVKKLLEKGFSALGRIADLQPFFAGSENTYVDFYAYFGLSPVVRVCRKTWEWDVKKESIKNLDGFFHAMDKFDSVKQVKADQA
jgi:glutathione S-transferase|tara:strand:- start:302 stop:874 length:573 start_codon:yes stop_codon:yes gene_type:complete